MQNWYKNFKTAQAQPISDDQARNEKINAITNQLLNQIFPEFANDIGQTVFNSGTSQVKTKVESWLNVLPERLGITGAFNRELIGPILYGLAADATKVVVENNQAEAWTLINRYPDVVQRYITRFISVCDFNVAELNEFKQTMQKK